MFFLQANDHAARIARFSLAAMEAARETPIDVENPILGMVKIRVRKKLLKSLSLTSTIK